MIEILARLIPPLAKFIADALESGRDPEAEALAFLVADRTADEALRAKFGDDKP